MRKVLLIGSFILLTGCSEFALLASAGSIGISQNAYVKAYNSTVCDDCNCLPITEKFAKGIFSLPLYPSLKSSDVIKISRIIKSIVNKI